VRITRPFYIGKHEVTQEVWEKVMGTNPSASKGAKNPVEMVSWNDCQDFLKKVNALGKERSQFRLPTEAQWEYACRAGSKTRFCSGDADAGLADCAWYDANSGRTTHPVGTKKPNAWGLYDCHGNVWEWCEDWYDEYSPGRRPKADPVGPMTGTMCALRGGSWLDDARHCRSACRNFNGPDDRYSILGFRLVTSSSRTP
jgi:formylglycine-generating enzyme required for sulfatase activity